MKKRATLIMQEVLNEPKSVRSSASNPQLLSPKVDQIEVDSRRSDDATPRKKSRHRVGSAQRTSKDNYTPHYDNPKPNPIMAAT